MGTDPNTPSGMKRVIISRRSFITASAALGGTVALAGCSSGTSSTDSGSGSGSGSDSSGDELRVGMEAANAPYNWQTDTESDYTIPIDGISGAYADGYDVQITKKVADALGKTPVAVKVSWSGLIDAVQKGSIDLIIAGMTATDERKESIDFTDPYFVDTFGLLVMKDGDYANATSLSDFSGAAVLGQKDTLLDDIIDDIPGVNHLTPVDSIPSAISRLLDGTCDAITYNVASTDGYLKANPALTNVNFAEGEGFQEDEPCSIGLKKGQDDLLSQLNDIVNGISEDERQELWTASMERQPS